MAKKKSMKESMTTVSICGYMTPAGVADTKKKKSNTKKPWYLAPNETLEKAVKKQLVERKAIHKEIVGPSDRFGKQKKNPLEEADDDEKSPEMNDMLDSFTSKSFGKSRSSAKNGSVCVICHKPATEFKDDISRKEYRISGMCQNCQDDTFIDESQEEDLIAQAADRNYPKKKVPSQDAIGAAADRNQPAKKIPQFKRESKMSDFAKMIKEEGGLCSALIRDADGKDVKTKPKKEVPFEKGKLAHQQDFTPKFEKQKLPKAK